MSLMLCHSTMYDVGCTMYGGSHRTSYINNESYVCFNDFTEGYKNVRKDNSNSQTHVLYWSIAPIPKFAKAVFDKKQT